MDAVSLTLISAFVAGAAKGSTKVGEQVVVDAYEVLKKTVIAACNKTGEIIETINFFEGNPDSKTRQSALLEELVNSRVDDNEDVVAAAEEVLEKAKIEHQALAIGIDWNEVKAAELVIKKIRARANSIGFKAAKSEIIGKVQIDEIDVGTSLGK